MKLFVTGVAGQLGHDVMNELNKRGYEGVGSDLAPEYSGIQDSTAVTTMPYISVDITDASAVEKAITEAGVDGVVHCAAWTAVDAAEDEDKQEIVRKVNVLGTENIAKVCKKLGIKMMYLSTDYVFDGQGTTPWEPDCKAYKPLNVYGQTKLDGELAVTPEALNAVLPEGVRVLEVYESTRKARELRRLRALLTLEYDGAVPEPAAITTLLERPELVVEKRTKRGMAETDIRPMLHAYHVEAAPGALLLTCEVSAQEPSLNPMLLAAAIERYLPGAKPDFIRCRRLEMLDEQGEVFR